MSQFYISSESPERDITSDSVVQEVAGAMGLNGKELIDKTHTDEIKSAWNHAGGQANTWFFLWALGE
jgi:2-hydroxychromene-2-carboxylate isomerase